MNIRKSIPEILSIPLIFLAALTLAGCGGAGSEGSGKVVATLSWKAPEYNTDNSSLTDLEEYRLYVADSPEDLITAYQSKDFMRAIKARENGKDVTEYKITDNDIFSESDQFSSNSGSVTIYFAMTACNSLGIESDLSEVVSKTF